MPETPEMKIYLVKRGDLYLTHTDDWPLGWVFLSRPCHAHAGMTVPTEENLILLSSRAGVDRASLSVVEWSIVEREVALASDNPSIENEGDL